MNTPNSGYVSFAKACAKAAKTFKSLADALNGLPKEQNNER